MNRKKNNPNKIPKNNFKFNIIWIYAAIAIIFFGLQMLNFDSTKQTSWQEFNRDMLQQKKVKKVVTSTSHWGTLIFCTSTINCNIYLLYTLMFFISQPDYLHHAKIGAHFFP